MAEEPLKKRIKRAIKDPVRMLAKDWSFFQAFPKAYKRAVAQTPVDPNKAILFSQKLLIEPDSFALMRPFLTDVCGMDVQFIGLGMNQHVGWTAYYKHCLQMMEELASSHFVFLDDASDVISCLPLRPETRVAQLWHACGAFKKWGTSTADLMFGGSRKEKARHPFYKNLSLVTVSSDEVAWAYREAMDLEDTPDVVRALGVSRTDIFFDQTFLASAREQVEQAVPAAHGKKILLYAPTFRGRVSEAEGPDALDIEELRQRLAGEWVLLIKHHPYVQAPPSIPDGCEDFAFFVADQPTDRLMAAADMLITDYSSVIFEYALLGRPMAFFAYDLEDYGGWRGFYYPYEEMTPGPVVRTTSDLAAYVESLHEGFDSAEVDAFRQKFMGACDGHSTERIVLAMCE